MMTPSEEDFELELRSLPGVLSVGVDHRDNGEVDGVTLFVRGQDPESVRHVALQVASLYYPTAAVTVILRFSVNWRHLRPCGSHRNP